MHEPVSNWRRAGMALLLGACISFGGAAPVSAAEPHTVTDAAGRKIVVSDTSRIVAIGGAVTEILYALGVQDRIIAVDTTSVYPASALASKPNVGYVRALSPEGVLSLGPSLVLAIEGSGPPDAVNVLTGASVPFVTVPEARDADAVVAKIRFIADVMGVKEQGEKVATAVAEDFAALAALRGRITTPRKAVFVLSAAGAAPTVGGSNSSADAILKLAGVENAMKVVQGFKPAVDEAMLAAEPDAIIMMQNRGHGLSDEAVLAMPAFAGTPAAQHKRLQRVDGQYTLGFGPRTPQAARDLAAAVYPELALPALPSRPWTAPTPTATGNGG